MPHDDEYMLMDDPTTSFEEWCAVARATYPSVFAAHVWEDPYWIAEWRAGTPPKEALWKYLLGA